MDTKDDELINWALLFRAVILQAARDAFLLNVSKKDKETALEFLQGGRDLELACEIAQVNYDKIRFWMKNISENNNLNFYRIKGEVK